MGAKRAKLEGAGMIDFIISELEKASKLDDETKNTLEGFKKVEEVNDFTNDLI